MANISQVTRYRYKDLNTDFAKNTEGLNLYDDQAVINDLLNLLGTPVGSVFFAPTYGTDFLDMLFDNITNATYKAFSTLGDDIARWVPAVTLYQDESYIVQTSPQSMDVRLVFSINGASPTTLGFTVNN